MIRATLVAEAALNAAAVAETGDKHLESQSEPTVERRDELQVPEELGT